MTIKGIGNPNINLEDFHLKGVKNLFINLKPHTLTQETLRRNQGTLSQNGTLTVSTGRFTGRSPKDRYIVSDALTQGKVDWNDINQSVSVEQFDILFSGICKYFSNKDVFVQDAAICQANHYRINTRLFAEYPWSAQFMNNMFVNLSEDELDSFDPEWTIYCAPGFEAMPELHGLNSKNFSIINFSRKIIIIGGTAYTGEIKKAMFSVLNFKLPLENNVLSMHCSANVGQGGDTAVFFGLSGTGKTTLSAHPNRELIGDDEHGWSDEGLFNFEGGCYAKCINLSRENEPEIFNAIRPGAILENIKFHPGTARPNFEDTSITQNTRVSYPLSHIKNLYKKEMAQYPKNIFFLCCDAFGVLPPLAKLSPEQAMFYFMSGYTAKVAGTEDGVIEPLATFSACFGAPFLPLHPNTYAELLGNKIKEHKVNIWFVNTGWIGGPYGVGERISLKYTRRLINAALEGELDDISYANFAVFDLKIPSFCSGVPGDILHPRNRWADKDAYNEKRLTLAKLFNDNFEQYADKVSHEISNSAPSPNKLVLEEA